MDPTDQAIQEVGKTARHYLDQILVAPLSELGRLFQDKIYFRRIENRVKTIAKLRETIKEMKIDPKNLDRLDNADVVIELLEQSSHSGDEAVAELFAGILASSFAPETAHLVHPSYAATLGQISPVDARILAFCMLVARDSEKKDKLANPSEIGIDSVMIHPSFTLTTNDVVSQLGLSNEIAVFSVANLARLGVFEASWDYTQLDAEYPISFTRYGYLLLKRCTENLTDEKLKSAASQQN